MGKKVEPAQPQKTKKSALAALKKKARKRQQRATKIRKAANNNGRNRVESDETEDEATVWENPKPQMKV